MKQVFDIVPPSGPAFTATAAVLVVVLVGLAALFAYVIYSAAHVRVEVSSEGVRIHGGLYGRLIPLRDLIVEQARITDLEIDFEHKLSWRTNGIGMPGYQAGWHRMKNGGKALAFVTDRRQVVFLPTRQKYAALLSVASPDQFLEALRAAAR